jgi:hypothetical protein
MSSRSQRLRRPVALAIAVAALAAPAASAAPIDPPGVGAHESQVQDQSYPGSVNSIVPPETSEPVTTTVTPAASADGFDWGDAGVGAAAMLALGTIAAGAAVTLGYRGGRQRVA